MASEQCRKQNVNSLINKISQHRNRGSTDRPQTGTATEDWKRNWYWGLGFGLVADARAQLKKSQTRSVIASAREITLIRIWILLQRRSSKSVTRSLSALWCPKVANNTRTHTHTCMACGLSPSATSCATGADCHCLLIRISDDVLIFESA